MTTFNDKNLGQAVKKAVSAKKYNLEQKNIILRCCFSEFQKNILTYKYSY